MAGAAIGAGASILGGVLGGKGAKKAAKAQAAAYQKGIDEQRREFDTTQQNFAPYLAAGTSALGGSLDLLGLNGNGAQGSAIDALKASPGFQAIYGQGLDALQQTAAATGGLRGGNTQNSLAQFGSNALADTIRTQLANLGGLVNAGSGAVGNLGSLGQQNATATANLLGQQGGANATGAAAPYVAESSTLGGLANIAGNYSLSQTIAKLLSGGGAGSGTGGSIGYGGGVIYPGWSASAPGAIKF